MRVSFEGYKINRLFIHRKVFKFDMLVASLHISLATDFTEVTYGY